jgi:hypothetical protein
MEFYYHGHRIIIDLKGYYRCTRWHAPNDPTLPKLTHQPQQKLDMEILRM